MDAVNSCFVLASVCLAWADAFRARRDHGVRGVHPLTILFAVAYPCWDLVYYRSLGQEWSLTACGLLVAGRLCWAWQAWRWA